MKAKGGVTAEGIVTSADTAAEGDASEVEGGARADVANPDVDMVSNSSSRF